jgi:hypothetical protein
MLKKLIYGLCGILISGTQPAYSGIVEVVPLSFGQFIITDNTSVHNLTIQRNGNINEDPAFHILENPVRGTYNVSNFPVRTNLIILANVASFSNLSNPSQFFTVSAFATNPQNVKTNNNGEVSFDLAATLQTSGNGIMYEDANYTGTLVVSVNY